MVPYDLNFWIVLTCFCPELFNPNKWFGDRKIPNKDIFKNYLDKFILLS